MTNTKALSTSPRNIRRRAQTAERRAQLRSDLAAIRDLAHQDIAGEPDCDVYTTCGLDDIDAAERAIVSWRTSAVQAGDVECVKIIDRLGWRRAAREYLVERLEVRS